MRKPYQSPGSDEKLILLYCPGRGSNSRPPAHRSFEHGQGVPHHSATDACMLACVRPSVSVCECVYVCYVCVCVRACVCMREREILTPRKETIREYFTSGKYASTFDSENTYYLYINLRRSRDCLYVSVAAGRPALFCSAFVVSSRCFIYLFWGSVTLST